MQDLHDQINDYQSQLDKGLEFQELMKKANAIVKKHEANKLERGLANKELVAIGLTYTQAEQVLTPDFMGRKGFPQYKLTNNNANNKRLKDRIEQIKTKLQGAKAVKNTGQAEEYVFDGGTIEVNYEIDRVQILFPGGRVDKELFKKLRSNGYVYSPTNQAFQRKITPQAIRNAIYLFDAKKIDEPNLEQVEGKKQPDELTEDDFKNPEFIKFLQDDKKVQKAMQKADKNLGIEADENETTDTEETKMESELNPRDSWYIKTQGTPYGIDRALLSLVKNGNNEVFEKDFKRVMSNPNYNTKEKFIEGINDEQTDILQKINKKEKEVNEWVERGGPHLKKLPKYDEWQNDIKALKILENHLSVLDAIAEHYFDEIAETNETPETPETKMVSTHYDKLKEVEGKKVQLPQSIWDVISQMNFAGSKIERADIWNEYRSLTLPIIKKTLWQIALDKPYTEVFKTGKEKLISFSGFDLFRAIKSAYAEQDLEISDKKLKDETPETPKKETLGSVSGGAFEEYADIEDELINQLELQGKLTRSDAQGILEANEEFAKDQYGIGVNTPRIAEKILALGKKTEPKKSEPFFRETGSDGYDSLIHKSKKENGKYVLRNEPTEEEQKDEGSDNELEHYKNILKNIDKYPKYSKKNVETIIAELEMSKGELYETPETHLEPNTPEEFDNDIDPDWDMVLGSKYKEVIKLDRPGFEKKFGIAVMGFDQLKLYITFKDKSTGELDLSRNARMGNYTPPAFDKLQDVQYWLHNAVQYIHDQPELILANLEIPNREWTNHLKGYAKGIIAPKLSEIKKYKVGDILVATKNIEKPNKFSIFYQKGERIKIDKISDLPNEITTYIVENMDYMGNNEKEFYNALPETYLNDNFENQQPMEIKEKVATSNLKPGDLIMINNVKYKVQGIKDERLLVNNLSDTAIPNRTDDFNLEYALANYSKIDKNVETKTIENSYTPDRIENRLLNPKGIQAFLTNKYDNQYQLNKGIEEFMTNKGAEPTTYTADEKAFIKKYSGYGGLSKFGTAGKGAFFEYYTPTPVIRKMWALAYKYGYKGGSILESSVGTGEFLALAPTNASITAYEINPFSADICRILYPQAKVFTQPFEQNFIENNFTIKDRVIPIYDLCIGNCPYGSFEIVQSRYLSGMGELKHVQAKNYAEYFLRRSLDLLKPGGLLILIIGADVVNGGKLFLDSDISPVKEYLAEHSDLLDAYRLPDSVFERTQVTTEIVVIQKK